MPEYGDYVCVSWMPGLMGVAGEIVDLTIIKQRLSAIIEHDVKGVLWILNDEGRAAPILLMPEAAKLHEHMMHWSSGVPKQWFELTIADNEQGYGLVVSPNLKASVNRYKFSILLEQNFVVPDDANIKLLFETLTFLSPSRASYLRAKDYLDATTDVGLIATVDLIMMGDIDYMEALQASVYWLRDIPINSPNTQFHDLLMDMIQKMADSK